MDSPNNMMKVLCPVTNEKTSKTYWVRIGNAFINRDQSINVYLDAYPSNGRLQLRELDERDLSRGRDRDADAEAGASAVATNDAMPF